MARTSPPQLKEVLRDFRRDQIIDVARQLFGERGTTEVSMDEIASEAGVARSTVYVYFANRDELLRACLKRMYNLLLDTVAGAWEREAKPADRLHSLVRGMLERIDDNPAFFRLAVATQGTGNHPTTTVGAELAIIGLDIARLLHDLVEQAVASGQFRAVDPDRAVAYIGQEIYGAMSVRADDVAPRPLDETADEICDFLLYGLAPPRS